jgi:hypothetical protein
MGPALAYAAIIRIAIITSRVRSMLLGRTVETEERDLRLALL